jgi:hypothetical protein
MPNSKQPSAECRLHNQLARTLNGTKASKDETTQVLIHLLAIQIASYDPLMRDAVWECAVDTLDDMVEDIAAEIDAHFINNGI